MTNWKIYYEYHFLTSMVSFSKFDIDEKLWCSKEGLVIKCKSFAVQTLVVDHDS